MANRTTVPHLMFRLAKTDMDRRIESLGEKITHIATFEELEVAEKVVIDDELWFEMINDHDLLETDI